MNKPLRIVCLGGGYVAIYLAWALKRAIKRGEVALTVVGRENFHTFHGLIPEVLAGKVQPEHVLSSARLLFPPARFHNAEVTAIDTETQTVTASRYLDGREHVLDYDHLVIGIGAVDDLSRYPGIAEHSLKLKTYWDCFKVRNHLLSMLELAEIEEDPEERRRLLTFVVAGGNYAGIEVAANIDDMLRAMIKKHYPGIDLKEVETTVVHPGGHVLPELGQRFPGLVKYTERYFQKQPQLNIRHGRRISAATPEEAVLDDGERIATRTIISCAGAAVSPLLDAFDFERDERGRVITEADCRVRGQDNIWAGGDCAAVPHPKGGYSPALALYAMMSGRHIGRNIKRLARGRKPKPYRFNELGDACVLGNHKAVAQLKGIPLRGFLAWMIWRSFMLLYLPTWDRRVRVFLDWLVLPFLGRDTVNVRVDSEIGFKSELYESEQYIVRQGDVGKTLYIIRSGSVEVLREDDQGREQVLGVLEAGDHFGETAVFQNVRRTASIRAREQTRVIALGPGAAHGLKESLTGFGEQVAQQPRTR